VLSSRQSARVTEMALNVWQSWLELDEQARRNAIYEKEFWAGLTEDQKRIFLEQADWQEIRLVPEAKQAWLDGLISLEDLCKHLGLTEVQVFFLMSTRKLPAALVGGIWKYDRGKVDRWVAEMGGPDAVKKDVEAQIEKHRAAGAGASPR
jgi:hypothetical protein